MMYQYSVTAYDRRDQRSLWKTYLQECNIIEVYITASGADEALQKAKEITGRSYGLITYVRQLSQQ